MCTMPTDLSMTVLAPLIGSGMIGLLLVMWNNLRHGRKYHEVKLADMSELAPDDRRWTLLGLGWFLATLVIALLYAGVTEAAKRIADWAGACGTPLPGSSMWPPTVVFAIFTLISAGSLMAKPLTPRWRTAATGAAWGFLSLTVGFAVAVFTADPAWLVWLPTAATLVPILAPFRRRTDHGDHVGR